MNEKLFLVSKLLGVDDNLKNRLLYSFLWFSATIYNEEAHRKVNH